MSGRRVQYTEKEPIPIIEDAYDAFFMLLTVITCGIITLLFKRKQRH